MTSRGTLNQQVSVSKLDIQQITKLYGTSVLNYLTENLKVVFVL